MFAFKPIASILSERKARIDQGLADADQARKNATPALGRSREGARRTPGVGRLLIAAAQKAAGGSAVSDIAATCAELDRMRVRQRPTSRRARPRDRGSPLAGGGSCTCRRAGCRRTMKRLSSAPSRGRIPRKGGSRAQADELMVRAGSAGLRPGGVRDCHAEGPVDAWRKDLGVACEVASNAAASEIDTRPLLSNDAASVEQLLASRFRRWR